MEGDDELLADMEVKAPPKRDEWMTTLPPERKVRAFSLPTASPIIVFESSMPRTITNRHCFFFAARWWCAYAFNKNI